MWYIGRAWGRARLKSRLGPLRRMHGNAHATHLDSKMVPSGRRAGRAPDHGRFASSPRAVVVVVVVVISCRASTGQSIGSRMTWDGSSRTPGAREEGRRRARRKRERHAGLLAVGGRRVLRRRQHRRGAHRARRERAERQGVRRLGSPKTRRDGSSFSCRLCNRSGCDRESQGGNTSFVQDTHHSYTRHSAVPPPIFGGTGKTLLQRGSCLQELAAAFARSPAALRGFTSLRGVNYRG